MGVDLHFNPPPPTPKPRPKTGLGMLEAELVRIQERMVAHLDTMTSEDSKKELQVRINVYTEILDLARKYKP